ncbi:hypothetical protein POF45_26745 [Pseudomonas sp. 681]|uniref:Uncharacterized protein n=1 Tax=Pseudomonas fungipugnans TaxID=3024217 RepID=A0ABT6QVT3_9PSED|nr:hypothetical protein [Pseudomonas sp. 681]MDI2594994.1 hypothetical protein [Pseudomonas sp. 681]
MVVSRRGDGDLLGLLWGASGSATTALPTGSGVEMTSRQRARRVLIWRGSFTAITVLTLLMLLGALADRVTQ